MSGLAPIKRQEEAKREAVWNPAARWQAIQDTITWAETQPTVLRNTPRRCLEAQAHKLRGGCGGIAAH